MVAAPDFACVIAFIVFYIIWVNFVNKTKEEY